MQTWGCTVVGFVPAVQNCVAHKIVQLQSDWVFCLHQKSPMNSGTYMPTAFQPSNCSSVMHGTVQITCWLHALSPLGSVHYFSGQFRSLHGYSAMKPTRRWLRCLLVGETYYTGGSLLTGFRKILCLLWLLANSLWFVADMGISL